MRNKVYTVALIFLGFNPWTVLSMDTPLQEDVFNQTSAELDKNSLLDSLLDVDSPIKLINNLILISQEKRQYHLNMANLCQEILGYSNAEKKNIMLQMYDFSAEVSSLNKALNCCIEDHTSWAKGFEDNIRLMGKVNQNFEGKYKTFMKIFMMAIETHKKALEYYTNLKDETLKSKLYYSKPENFLSSEQRNNNNHLSYTIFKRF